MSRTRRAAWLIALLGSALAPAPAGAGEGETPPARAVAHLTGHTTVESGRSRVIHFTVTAAPEAELALTGMVSDPDVLRIIREPAVLEGETLGTIRVRGLRPGRATLTIDGRPLAVTVIEPAPDAGGAVFAPRIVGPADGAVIWGHVALGVEIRVRPGMPLRQVTLDVGDRLTLLPEEDSQRDTLPYRQLRFTLDTRDLPEGPVALRTVATDASWNEQFGAPVRVRVARPADDLITEGEAESRYELGDNARFGGDNVTVSRDDEASGGRYVTHTGPFPAIGFPVNVRRPGWYQMMVRARGTRAQGALPLLAVIADNPQEPLTNGRLLSERWHRVAVGVPFRLDAGRHALTPLFGNDFDVPGLADRDLHLDRIEVARVGYVELPGADAAADGDERSLDDPFAQTAAPLRVAFVEPANDDNPIGALEIRGRVWWNEADDIRTPVVTALVNGTPVQPQRAREPRFWIDPARLEPGVNRIQLLARTDHGPVAVTPVRRFERAPGAAPPSPRRILRYNVHDERWDASMRRVLREQPMPARADAAAFFTRRAVAVDLPPDLTGTFVIYAEAIGGSVDEPPMVSVSLFNAAGMNEIGRVAIPGGPKTTAAGTTTLPFGRKRLVVRLENEPAPATPGTPPLRLKALLLAEQADARDSAPPAVEVRYPPAGHAVYGADAVVARATDNTSLRRAELLVDGAPTGQAIDLGFGTDPIVFPLLARTIAPGPHTLSVRVTDHAGNAADAAPRAIEVRAEAPDAPGRYDRAVRLLNRFAYGPDQRELATILTRGETAWLDETLRGPLDRPEELLAINHGLPLFPGLTAPEVTGRTLSHLMLTPNPARARFVLWVENHFSTWIRKTGAETKWNEHVRFSALGAASFDRLLFASAESPAMITYLDQVRSYAGRLNENYAREIMELHTLGVDGGYDQEDVTNLARLLTGWTASLDGDGQSAGPAARRYTFRFDAALNEGDVTDVFGIRFTEAEGADRLDRAVLIIEHLASHPSTARYITTKIANHYIATPAPEAVVDELVRVFLETGGDLAAVIGAVAGHELFATEAPPDRVTQPLDYVIRLYRATGHHDPLRAMAFLQTSGQGLFDHPTPDGYPEEDANYVGTNAMVQRRRLALDATEPLVALVPPAWRWPGDDVDEAWAQSVIDVIAVRLTGRILAESSNEAALDVLAAAAGRPDDRIRVVAPFIALLPEVNLR